MAALYYMFFDAYLVCFSIQWNLSNLDTLGTISGAHFMEVSLQELVSTQVWPSCLEYEMCPDFRGPGSTVVSLLFYY